MAASLVSLPPELVNMILGALKVKDLGNISQLSKSYYERFRALYRYQAFSKFRVELKGAALKRLLKIARGDLKYYFRHLTICPTFSFNELRTPELRSLLIKVLSRLPNLRVVDFDIEDSRFPNAFEHWGAFMRAVIASKKTNFKTIKAPRSGLAMSKFNMTEGQLLSYEQTFTNLKTLEITTSVKFEHAQTTFDFWNWVWIVGTNIEDLRVASYRSSWIVPVPDTEDRFLPPCFDLPKLKKLKLVDVCLTFKDMEVMLRHTDKLESLNITRYLRYGGTNCFFEMLQHLRSRQTPRLQHLRLKLGGYDRTFGTRIVNLRLNGCWTDERTICKVDLQEQEGPTWRYRQYRKFYSCEKSLWRELGVHDAQAFWISLTDGRWSQNNLMSWRRRRDSIYIDGTDSTDDEASETEWSDSGDVEEGEEFDSDIDLDEGKVVENPIPISTRSAGSLSLRSLRKVRYS